MAALKKVLQALHREGESRRQISNAYHARFDDAVLTFALQRIDGGIFNWELADPAELLRVTLDESPRLQQLYSSALERYPCSDSDPWHMIVAYDEFSAGAQLKVHNARTTMDLLFSFGELGPFALSLTCTWLMPLAIRHDKMMALVGGWPNAFRLIMRQLFMSTESFGTTGVAVMVMGQACTIYAKLRWLLSDGDGHRMTMCWRGANGMRPCLGHTNVLMKNASVLETLGDIYVDISCHEPHRFKVQTSHEFAVSCEKVRGWMLRGVPGR